MNSLKDQIAYVSGIVDGYSLTQRVPRTKRRYEMFRDVLESLKTLESHNNWANMSISGLSETDWESITHEEWRKEHPTEHPIWCQLTVTGKLQPCDCDLAFPAETKGNPK